MNLPAYTQGIILDMDGVLWRDTEPIGNLGSIFGRFEQLGTRVVLATNNSTRTIDQYLAKLRNFGVELQPWQIVTSSLAAASTLKERYPDGGDVFAIGESGLIQPLTEHGFRPIDAQEADQAIAVVMGMDRAINYEKLKQATLLIRRGVPFYATNPDRTYPTPQGLIPGAGALISALVTASDIEPIVVGKPSSQMLELALKRLGTSREKTFVIGDRIETDIAGGQRIGCPTGLVLSGVSDQSMAEAWRPAITIVSKDLSTMIGIS